MYLCSIKHNFRPYYSMKTKRIEIEHPLNSTSRNIVWQLISTAEGLSGWIADSVVINGNKLTFSWGDAWRHHETRKATITRRDRFAAVRWHWDDEDDDSYVEIRMERGMLSGEITLHIIDFTTDDDSDWLYAAWQHNFDNLKTKSGV